MESVYFNIGITADPNGFIYNYSVNLSDVLNVAIGGATGSGKSVLLHQIIASINAPVVLIDCKGGLEFTRWEASNKVINHKCYSDMDDIRGILQSLTDLMAARYKAMTGAGVRHYSELNKPIQPIVVIVDEVQEIMRDRKTKPLLISLVKRGRACGFHFIIATQTPSKKILGDIKDQCGAGISLRVKTPEASRLLLGTTQAVDIDRAGGLYFKNYNTGEVVACMSLLTDFKQIQGAI